MDRPVAAAGQRLAGEAAVVDQHVERDLVGHVGRALQRLAEQGGPALPVRRVGREGEDPGVDQRVADQPVGRLPVEARFERRAVDRGEFLPGMAVVAHRAVDLGRHSQRARTRSGEEQGDRIALLHPAIAVDPEIEVVAREIARQERPGRQRLVAVLQRLAAGKVEIPLRNHQGGAALTAPVALLFGQSAIEDAQRQRPALPGRLQGLDAVAHQVEIGGIAAGDDDGSLGLGVSAHVAKMAYRQALRHSPRQRTPFRGNSWASMSTTMFR